MFLAIWGLRGRHFTFDTPFLDSTTQQEAHSTITLLGRNGSVFFCGAIGAGKTYRMLGTMEYTTMMAFVTYLMSLKQIQGYKCYRLRSSMLRHRQINGIMGNAQGFKNSNMLLNWKK